ncbi:unnamed protein product [Protopolystoma xenopodis]|uniref:Uncharacterized protein n=1 Tax=Protopolystoma xenopodis TaxID=117903 RepID=A0A3S5AHW4_9PLAT|nr:unnamed protein product [Protopolystoma xenopodis]
MDSMEDMQVCLGKNGHDMKNGSNEDSNDNIKAKRGPKYGNLEGRRTIATPPLQFDSTFPCQKCPSFQTQVGTLQKNRPFKESSQFRMDDPSSVLKDPINPHFPLGSTTYRSFNVFEAPIDPMRQPSDILAPVLPPPSSSCTGFRSSTPSSPRLNVLVSRVLTPPPSTEDACKEDATLSNWSAYQPMRQLVSNVLPDFSETETPTTPVWRNECFASTSRDHLYPNVRCLERPRERENLGHGHSSLEKFGREAKTSIENGVEDNGTYRTNDDSLEAADCHYRSHFVPSQQRLQPKSATFESFASHSRFREEHLAFDYSPVTCFFTNQHGILPSNTRPQAIMRSYLSGKEDLLFDPKSEHLPDSRPEVSELCSSAEKHAIERASTHGFDPTIFQPCINLLFSNNPSIGPSHPSITLPSSCDITCPPFVCCYDDGTIVDSMIPSDGLRLATRCNVPTSHRLHTVPYHPSLSTPQNPVQTTLESAHFAAFFGLPCLKDTGS